MKRGMTRPMNEAERTALFWSRVDRSGECWPWTGPTQSAGRGTMRWVNGRTELAYRISWQIANGPIPAGMYICHSCDNPLCVRPSHLFVGTPTANVEDMCGKGRWAEPPHLSGQSHPRAEKSDEFIRAARERFAEGHLSISALARDLGVSHSTLTDWLRGNVRADAGGPILGGAA